MTNLNDIKAVKQTNAAQLESVVSKHVESLKSSPEWVSLIGKVLAFEDDPYSKQYSFEFDECGFLDSVLELEIPESWHDEDSDVLEAIADTLSNEFEACYFRSNLSDSTIKVHQCLGSPTTIAEHASRNEYYVHSTELGLKLTKKDVVSTEHALFLIECAMRKAGVFDNIVNVDYYGYFISFVDTDLGTLSDDELAKYGEQFNEAE